MPVHLQALASPSESSCPEQGQAMSAIQELQRESSEQRATLESTKARLSSLEALLPPDLRPACWALGDPARAAGELEALRGESENNWKPKPGLESAYSSLVRDKSALEEEKRQLQAEKRGSGRRLESSSQEVASLRRGQCPQAHSRSKDMHQAQEGKDVG